MGTAARAPYRFSTCGPKQRSTNRASLSSVTFEKLDACVDSHLKVELAAERVHHDASPIRNLHQLIEQLPVVTFRRDAKLNPGESRRGTSKGRRYLSLNVGDFCLPRLNGREQVAHETP